jgi:hypothetical protein
MVGYQLDKYKFDIHHNHGWDYKESDYHEPPLLDTHDPLANTHDPKSKMKQANRDTTTFPPKLNQDHHRRYGHCHIGLYRTPLSRREIDFPTLCNIEISHQGKLFQTTKQSSCPSHAFF